MIVLNCYEKICFSCVFYVYLSVSPVSCVSCPLLCPYFVSVLSLFSVIISLVIIFFIMLVIMYMLVIVFS